MKLVDVVDGIAFGATVDDDDEEEEEEEDGAIVNCMVASKESGIAQGTYIDTSSRYP